MRRFNSIEESLSDLLEGLKQIDRDLMDVEYSFRDLDGISPADLSHEMERDKNVDILVKKFHKELSRLVSRLNDLALEWE